MNDECLIRLLKPDDEELLQDFLRQRAESSMLMLGNLLTAGLRYSGARCEAVYAACFRDGRIEAVAAHCWNGNIILQADHLLQKLLPHLLAASGRKVMGFIGLRTHVEQACAVLGWSAANFRMYEPEGLYSLELDKLQVPNVLSTPGIEARRANETDEALLCEWRESYNAEALGIRRSAKSRREAQACISQMLQNCSGWILTIEGKRAATSAFNAAAPGIVQIGGVYTPPNYRGRGYARAVVAQSLLDARVDGAAKAVLFTGDQNTPAIRAYAALGFQRIGDFCLAFR